MHVVASLGKVRLRAAEVIPVAHDLPHVLRSDLDLDYVVLWAAELDQAYFRAQSFGKVLD